MIDVNRIRSHRGKFLPVEPGWDRRNRRPCIRIGGPFAREVSGLEFFEGGVDVVGIELDVRHDPLVGVDLDDVEHLDAEISLAGVGGPDFMSAAASATACKFAITTSRPSHNPAFTTGRRSSMKLSSVRISASAAQLRAAK